MTRLRLPANVLATFVVLIGAAGAQPRVMIGATPAPGQTVRLRMTQEMDFVIKPIGDAVLPGMPKDGIHSKGKSTLLLKQQVGAVDADGRLRLDLTYEDLSQDLKVNDAAVPVQQGELDKVRGKVVTMWMGKDLQVLDVSAPEGFPIPADQLKQFLGPLVASLPHQEMSVGEAVTLPFSMALPIPTPAGSAAPLLTGQTKTTLMRVTPEGDDQVATLQQSLDVSYDSANETSAGRRVRMNMKIAGSGTTDTYVRGGMVKSNVMSATMNGQFLPEGGSAAGMKLSGTMSMTVERVP